jgi:hypothetical protein
MALLSDGSIAKVSRQQYDEATQGMVQPVVTFSVSPEPMTITSDHRRALLLLAASPGGCSEANMLAKGFKLELIAEMIRDGLVAAHIGNVYAGKRPVVRITQAGWQALGNAGGAGGPGGETTRASPCNKGRA